MRLSTRMAAVLLAGFLFPWCIGCGGGESDSPPPASIGTSGKAGTSAQDKTPAEDPLHPVVVMETSLGTMTLRLDAEHAPLTVDNFLAYVEEGFYEGTVFHQIFRGQGVVGGGYTADGRLKSARSPIRNEADNGLKNRRGTIAMLRSPDSIDSAQSQFFINLADNELLDHRDRTPEGYGYCVFGQVVEGLDVLDKIANVSVKDTPEMSCMPVEPVLIKSMRRVK